MAETRPKKWGLTQVYTGNGKGKTTAALGLAVRAVGAGKRVVWIAFDKGGESHYSERNTIRERFPEIRLDVTGLDRIDAVTGKFRMGVTDEDREEGRRGLELMKQAFSDEKADLVVLDEINSSTSLGILDEKEVLGILETKPETIELVMTGRDAPQAFRDLADLVTEMTLVKHYYYSGVGAREGLDF
ncbi:cob(I)yrinic acid a,c-diamide adenosyltransferase [Candidatus Uhrbacteria bacterium]|nr:cob(I)yrinic acid a,c-diamide adenosyltransferase [Candidatus Uhrbacteria bacterium]